MTTSSTNRARLAALVAEVHRIATAKDITRAEAATYFRDPHRLAETVIASRVLDDEQRRAELHNALERLQQRATQGDGDGI